MTDLLHAAPFQNVIPRPFCKGIRFRPIRSFYFESSLQFPETEKIESKIKRLEQKYAKLQVASVVQKLGSAKVRLRENSFECRFVSLAVAFSIFTLCSSR